MLESLKQRARLLKGELHALYLVARDRRTPWYAKLIIALVVAYSLSPIDLIPDFIPLLGYLDDLLLLPLGIYLALQLIPTDVLDDARRRAADSPAALPKRWFAAWLVIILWLVALAAAAIVIASLLDDMEIQTWIGA
jgi:uncharacterized membrane protein YkvA (DUF1232 family)